MNEDIRKKLKLTQDDLVLCAAHEHRDEVLKKMSARRDKRG